MPKDFLQGVSCEYDTIVIGSGLAGLTCANTLARAGHRVLLLEQHYKLGGMATWFRRSRGRIFDISLHGFPVGMIKSCRRYWTREIADSIIQLKRLSFDNPMFALTTSFDRDDFVRLLTRDFRVPAETVASFFEAVRGMNFYDDQSTTVGQLFERFFPGREDVVRLLMEPIAYANGSTLEDPAITYGIVFSNFMSKGVYTFRGGTNRLIKLMHKELERNGVDVRIKCDVERILVNHRRQITGVRVGGREIKCATVVSNANLKSTIFRLVGERHFDPSFVDEARAIRLNSSSTQVYISIKPGEMIDQRCGDLLFSSTAPLFRTDLLLGKNITSREFSFYYPELRPDCDRCFIVASTNARYEDWAFLGDEDYELAKRDLVESTFACLEKYVPNIRTISDHAEASTPRTFEHYTRHANGASFGTKFEGLAISRGLPQQVSRLYHAGSVGIIMSGWLGAMNYGVIVANEVDAILTKSPGAQLALATE
ncbi:MAG: NAD(P)/FAD-dependent oxidoreductase [Pirellulales bacterium]|nr:NAD(P)/FAD-dependent oxidoreductase [Pirellulales bacterium]